MVDERWGAVHDAERLLVPGMADAELLTMAISLDAETRRKLSGWRGTAASTLFSTLDLAKLLKAGTALTVPQQEAARAAVVEALKLLHEDSDNRYHRLRLVATQLQYLVGVLALVICAVLILAYKLGAGTPFDISRLIAVLCAGALGGAVSAMYQLSRIGEAKVPEALMHGVITSGRPVVAAASALFIYTLLVSKVINLVPTDFSLAVALVFSFVAGFSEKFVLGTVSKVVGAGARDEREVRER